MDVDDPKAEGLAVEPKAEGEPKAEVDGTLVLGAPNPDEPNAEPVLVVVLLVEPKAEVPKADPVVAAGF